MIIEYTLDGVVDTELPAAAPLADGDAIPTTPTVGAVIRGINSVGTVDNAKLAKAHDLDTSGSTEYATGVSLRKSASGGSVELGTQTDPMRTDPTGSTAQPVTDNGGSLTVDGAVTVSGAVAATQSGTWNINNVSGAVSLPTGAATETTLAALLTELYIMNGAMAQQTDDTGTTTYRGWASPGTATSAASWRITRIVSSGTPADYSITFADGNRNFDNVWDNRASLSYS